MADLEELNASGSSQSEPSIKNEVIASNMWTDKDGNPVFVHLTYNYNTTEALMDGYTAAELMEKIELKDKEGKAIETPALKEIKMLRTTCKKTADGEYAVRAILRYVPEVEAAVTTDEGTEGAGE